MIALPLRVEGELIGSLHILAAEADAFDDKEMELLHGDGRRPRLRPRRFARARTRRGSRGDDQAHGPFRRGDRAAEPGAPARPAHRGDRIGEGRAAAVALLRIEMERFREINETLGDARSTSWCARSRRGSSPRSAQAGLLARMADSEFAVVLPRGGAEQAMQWRARSSRCCRADRVGGAAARRALEHRHQHVSRARQRSRCADAPRQHRARSGPLDGRAAFPCSRAGSTESARSACR